MPVNHCNVFCDDGQIFMTFPKEYESVAFEMSMRERDRDSKRMKWSEHMQWQMRRPKENKNDIGNVSTQSNIPLNTRNLRSIYVNVLILLRLLFL